VIDPSVRLYRALLRLYPPEFRAEFGGPMAQCFRDLCRAADSQGRPRRLLGVWLRLLPDLALSLAREHLDSRKKRRGIMTTPFAAIDRYQIKAKIGDGSIASVFRAFDPQRGAEVAIKLLKPAADSGPESHTQWGSRLEREAEVLASLDHPAVPKFYASGQTDAGPYLVMEYIPGRTMLQCVEENEGFIDESSLIQWGIQVCAALSFFHTHQPEALLFRDLKPSNLIVDDAGTVHLLDYDITTAYIAGQTYEGIGTEGYAAPEQYSGHEEPRSDLYTLGATLHHLTTRIDPRQETKHRPFTFAPPRSVNPALSKAFAAVIQRALAYEVEDRYPTAAQMQAALKACR
jgi:serine/threonine protein kinase